MDLNEGEAAEMVMRGPLAMSWGELRAELLALLLIVAAFEALSEVLVDSEESESSWMEGRRAELT